MFCFFIAVVGFGLFFISPPSLSARQPNHQPLFQLFKGHSRLCKILGIANKDDPIKPLFTSYQMRAFEENKYPYKVQAEDPTDASRWQ